VVLLITEADRSPEDIDDSVDRSIIGQSSLLLYADLDGLKEINDTFGHSEGSLAIAKTAEVLRQTFRNSDIVSRLGGDEFAILAQNVPRHEVENITARLEENLCRENKQNKHCYQLSLRVGAVWIAHDAI